MLAKPPVNVSTADVYGKFRVQDVRVHPDIEEMIAALHAGDLLLIAGKGHETGQIVGTTELPFSDADVPRAALGARSSRTHSVVTCRL